MNIHTVYTSVTFQRVSHTQHHIRLSGSVRSAPGGRSTAARWTAGSLGAAAQLLRTATEATEATEGPGQRTSKNVGERWKPKVSWAVAVWVWFLIWSSWIGREGDTMCQRRWWFEGFGHLFGEAKTGVVGYLKKGPKFLLREQPCALQLASLWSLIWSLLAITKTKAAIGLRTCQITDTYVSRYWRFEIVWADRRGPDRYLICMENGCHGSAIFTMRYFSCLV